MTADDRRASESLLSACASQPANFMQANSELRLVGTFKEIASEISKVRIVH